MFLCQSIVTSVMHLEMLEEFFMPILEEDGPDDMMSQ